ncbi:ribonuclease III [Myroides odoratus]|uniref:ribonuclease III n=1 Tax=Myroides odoratus TaxID=256 RepID=UPI0039B0028A
MLNNVLNKIFKNSRSNQKDGNFCRQISQITKTKPFDVMYYKLAFTHRSMNILDKQGNPLNYERLEFLGDAILNAVIASHLYLEVPSGDEGYLTKMRSKIVSRENLNSIGKNLGLIDIVESKMGNQQFGENIHGNILEALIGAIYLDQGYPACEKFIHQRLISTIIDIHLLETKITSYKSLLIEWCQKTKHTFKFDAYEETSNEEVKYFGVKLFIDNKLISKGRATSKKKAEEKASQRAYFALQEKINH